MSTIIQLSCAPAQCTLYTRDFTRLIVHQDDHRVFIADRNLNRAQALASVSTFVPPVTLELIGKPSTHSFRSDPIILYRIPAMQRTAVSNPTSQIYLRAPLDEQAYDVDDPLACCPDYWSLVTYIAAVDVYSPSKQRLHIAVIALDGRIS